MAVHGDAHIAKRAYEIWEKEGRPHGRDREHWLKAAEELSTTIAVDPVVLKPIKAAAPKAPPAARAPLAAKAVAAPVAPKKLVAKPQEAVTVPARTKSAPKKKK